MRDGAGPPRLLWPSTPDEARQELERIGAPGPWSGPLGTPPHGTGASLSTRSPVTLRLTPPVPADLDRRPLPDGVERCGGEAGIVLTGPLEVLLTWLDDAVDGGAAAAAVRSGAGLVRPAGWRVRDREIGLGPRTLLMAAINTTPDSFWAGSRARDHEAVTRAVEEAVTGGADLLDIGGESTRPGAAPLDEAAERERVLPAVEIAVRSSTLPVSIDTRRAGVAAAALEAGAVIINDISGGTDDPAMLPLAVESGAGIVLMHRQGVSATMQEDPHYHDLMGEIASFLALRATAARGAGVAGEGIVIDPGLGFGKRRRHNFELYRRMAELHALGYPLLVGPSRKRHLSGPADRGAEDRLPGTLAACALLAREGVQILRVHDVRAVRLALDTADEIRGALIEDRVS